YIGEITDGEKSDFLSGAICLLAPADWPEPFGLVLIEAMACGCPVIAYGRGAIPEVIEDGVTGFVGGDEAGARAAPEKLSTFSPRTIRKRFERRFTARRMANDYLAVYLELIAAAEPSARTSVSRRSDGKHVVSPPIAAS